MRIEFDPAKSAINEAERGLPFTHAIYFDFETAFQAVDTRRDYKEPGLSLMVSIQGGIRVISLRKANKKEQKKYAKEKER